MILKVEIMLKKQILHYKIISLLGEGGMAKVYLANDSKFDTTVAIKLLNKEYVHNENIRKRFLSEAKSMFRMSHPNIIKVTDLIDDGDEVAFVMECVEGKTLKEYIESKGKLSDETIKLIFSQMLDAVGYVHKQNLVHRDIKPSNFMIDSNQNVKLMDFGIAKNTDANAAEYTQTGTGMQMGTPMYMSPEQVRNTKDVTKLSDLYSLGVVLWQMVTGYKPYDTKIISSFDLQTKIVAERLPLTNTLWDNIIEKATEKKVSYRFSDCASFSQVINESLNIKTPNNQKQTIEQTKPIEKLLIRDDKKEVSKIILKEDIFHKTRKWLISFVVVLMGFLLFWFFFNSDKTDFVLSNEKKSVIISNQEWKTENLNVTNFRNGDPILQAQTEEDWEKAGNRGQPAWCYHHNNHENGNKYGKLYNWYAVVDNRGLAPEGWHIPTNEEWSKLIGFLGGKNIAGKKMKSLDGWTVNGKGTNETGFTALPGGSRNSESYPFTDFEGGYWWSSSKFDSSYAMGLYLNYANSAEVGYFEKSNGLSVRCIKNQIKLNHFKLQTKKMNNSTIKNKPVHQSITENKFQTKKSVNKIIKNNTKNTNLKYIVQ